MSDVQGPFEGRRYHFFRSEGKQSVIPNAISQVFGPKEIKSLAFTRSAYLTAQR